MDGTDHPTKLGEHRFISQTCGVLHSFGKSKVDHLWRRDTIVHADKNVGWLYVAVNDSLMMGMLNCLAYWDEQLQSLSDIQFVAIAIF